MQITSFLLIVTLGYLNWKDKGCLSYAKVFLALVLSFHFFPLIGLYLNDYVYSIDYLRNEITVAIAKVTLTCLFISFGILLSKYLFRHRKARVPVQPKRPSIVPWARVNVIAGIIIILNNAVVAQHALSSGYLDIYVSAPTFLPIKTITVLPVYVFTLFLCIWDWMDFGQMHIKKFKYSVPTVFILLVLSFLFTGSRSTMMYLILTLLVIWSTKHKIKIWKYVPFAVGIILLSVIIGLLRDGTFSELDLSTVLSRPMLELANTSIVFLKCDSITNEFVIGARYFSGLLYLFPVRLLLYLGIDPPSLLSQQYVNIVDPGWADAGGGFGFSLLAEFYLLGGQWGAWIFALATGIALGWIDSNLKSSNIEKSALAGSLGFFVLFSVRGEIVELYRNIAVVLVLYLITILRSHKKSSGRKSVSPPDLLQLNQ